MLPQCPFSDAVGSHSYINTTWGKRLVSQYSGLNFHQVERLDYVTYLLWRRDAYIQALSSTEDGRAYLDDCCRMEQTKADRKKLHQILGKGGVKYVKKGAQRPDH